MPYPENKAIADSGNAPWYSCQPEPQQRVSARVRSSWRLLGFVQLFSCDAFAHASLIFAITEVK